ncbi:MAG: hypothetical protein L3J24_06045 [Xanthomonadales bacterium]|nr:hypothetical protein [Xanthomonadales bacterium]
MRIFVCLLLASTAINAQTLTVVDISSADAAQVEQLKQTPADGWWLEMGNQLAVVGQPDVVRRQASGLGILGTYDGIDKQHLLLRAHGCADKKQKVRTGVK